MQFAEEEICQLTESIWISVLGLEVRRATGTPELPQERTLIGCVQITGAWEGAVTLHCAAGLARQAAGVMFGIDPESTSVEEVQDALAELANMTGGNLKTLLPEPCHLSFPTVVEGSNYTLRIPGSRLVSQVAFECQGYPLQVTLVEKGESEGWEK